MNRPYKMVAHVSYYVYEIENTGELGKTLSIEKLREFGIKNKIIEIGVGDLDKLSEKAKAFPR